MPAAASAVVSASMANEIEWGGTDFSLANGSFQLLASGYQLRNWLVQALVRTGRLGRIGSLISERFDGIEIGGFPRGVNAKEKPNSARNRKSKHDPC